MFFEPQFLSKQDILAFKKDTCIFCNEKFEIEKTGEVVGRERRGSHYTEHSVDVLYKTFLVSDLDIYVFDFEFDENTNDNLKRTQREFIEEIKKEKQEEAPKLRMRLEKKFQKSNLSLSKRNMGVAVNALVEDYLSEINPLYSSSKTKLEERIESMFHNLKLGDLQLIKRSDWSDDYVEGVNTLNLDCIRYYYNPSGLKTHQRCWPFDKVNGSVEFPVRFGDFFEYIKRNKKFVRYDSLFKKFPDLWRDVLDLEITINAKEYSPVDYVKTS